MLYEQPLNLGSPSYAVAQETQDPPCNDAPEIQEHATIHPLRLAESIGFTTLASVDLTDHIGGNTAEEEPASAPETFYERGLRRAWELVEYGVSLQQRSLRKRFLDTAQFRFETVKNHRDVSLDHKIRATVGALSLQSFQTRSLTSKPSKIIMNETYRGLAVSLSEFACRQPLLQHNFDVGHHDIPKGEAQGALAEALVYAMLLREGDPTLCPYPSSTREDKANFPNADFNHDLYIIRQGKKVPVQVKRQEFDGELEIERSRRGIATIALNPIITQEADTLLQEMKEEGSSTSWSEKYYKMPADTFLACCLDPSQNMFHTPDESYAATILVKRVSKAVVEALEFQIIAAKLRK